MNKSQVIAEVAKVTLTQQEARAAVEAALETVRVSLRKGERVTLSGFGTFIVKRRLRRVARNPRTGALVQLPDRLAVRFKPAPRLLR